MNSWLLLTFILASLNYTQGDTKVLREINIAYDGFKRLETISLKNEKELVIEGSHVINSLPYTIETIYVADKDGYRVKYKLMLMKRKIQYSPTSTTSLNPNTLKTSAG